MESREAVQEAPTARGRKRRERIIEAATLLFHEQGFHATSIDEIGTAAGITGPGLYRHFSSKDEILLAVFDRIWELLRGAIERTEGLTAGQAFDVLIDAHTTLAMDRGESLMLLVRELRHVPEYYQRAAAKNDGRYTDAWADAVTGLCPGVGFDEARLIAGALMGLIGSAARDGAGKGVAMEQRRRLLREMCWSSLGGLTK